MIERFKAPSPARCRTCRKRELSWRLHFIMGALSYTLAGTDALKLIAELAPGDGPNDELLLRRLAPFLLAGLTSPRPDTADGDRSLDVSLDAIATAGTLTGRSSMLTLLWLVAAIVTAVTLAYVERARRGLDRVGRRAARGCVDVRYAADVADAAARRFIAWCSRRR